MSIEAMKQLLDALDKELPHNMKHIAAGQRFNARVALEQAQKQKPVAECVDDGEGGIYYRTITKHIGLLYTSPPPSQTEQIPSGDVKLPTSVEEAEAMEKIGYAYLQTHAPERLTPQRQPLTDEVANVLYKNLAADERTKQFTAQNWFQAGLSTGEAAHGITGEQK